MTGCYCLPAGCQTQQFRYARHIHRSKPHTPLSAVPLCMATNHHLPPLDSLDLVSLRRRWATPPGPPATAGPPPFSSPLPLAIPFTFLHLHRAVYFVQLRVFCSLPHSFNQACSVRVRSFVQFLRFRSLYLHDYRQSPVRCVWPNLLLRFDGVVLAERIESTDGGSPSLRAAPQAAI